MKFEFPNIRVKDMEASKAFYQQLAGLKVRDEMQFGNGIKLAFMTDDDGNIIELVEGAGHEIDYGRSNKVCFVFKVDDILAEKDRVEKAGYQLDGELIETPTGTKMFFVVDPNGIPIQITQMGH